ncbi:cation channel sperm-associated protein subunit delta [Echinops telfairi]|uniref:Cation channel sperm-associated auxiliary subunit delta n=1 Tax=Echinops telfairi TaxID=9371 RepID=A0ABM1VMW1_ECHTE|nr:cation channel sperm-associated protein subunit delta [Echinops telfairi]
MHCISLSRKNVFFTQDNFVNIIPFTVPKALEGLSHNIFAYTQSEAIAKANIYYSKTLGKMFQKYTFEHKKTTVGLLGGIFPFYSLSQHALLVVRGEKANFMYTEHPLNRSLGLTFDYRESLNVVLASGLKGILVLWYRRTLLISRNAGQLVKDITVNQGSRIIHNSIDLANITIATVAVEQNEVAIFTKHHGVYYGSLGSLSDSIIHITNTVTWSEDKVLTFTDQGLLQIFVLTLNRASSAVDLLQCELNIQEIFMDPRLEVDSCQIEYISGHFAGKMFTMDMKSRLELFAIVIPQLRRPPVPLVTVSNPHSLGLEVDIREKNYTMDGNFVFQVVSFGAPPRPAQPSAGPGPPLPLPAQVQTLRGLVEGIKRPTLSSVTVDMANKEISCMDFQPMTALISIGCDLGKKIIVQNNFSACSKGVLDPVVLQDNYTYTIEKEAYDPKYLHRKANKDLIAYYPYNLLGCPLLLYYDYPWKPVVEFSMTAEDANCKWQPQNWSTIIAKEGLPFRWSRENYESCHESEEGPPLKWPDVPYEIVGGPTDNKLIFNQRNGIYIFWLSIVDPYYSYCTLQTTFSIYVFGAFPMAIFPMELLIVLMIVSVLLSLWLVYALPKTQLWARLFHKHKHVS